MFRFLFILLFSCVTCMCVCSCAMSYLDKAQVPQIIQDRLKQEYLGVKMLRWQKQGTLYTADFRRAKYDYQYIFDEKATILQRKQEIRLNLLPTIIAEKVQKYYPQYQLREAIQLLQNEKDTFYITEIQRGMKFYQLYFTPKGNYKQKKIILPDDKMLLLDMSFLRN